MEPETSHRFHRSPVSSIVIVPSYRRLDLLPFRLLSTILYAFLTFVRRATYPTNVIILGMVTVIIFSEECTYHEALSHRTY
jgi:hypothetical protein